MEHGWQGDRIRLVPLHRERHFENAWQWINSPVITEWLLAGDFPMTRLAESDWFDSVSHKSESEIFFAIETLDGEHIGFSGIHRIEWRHGVASTGSMIGRQDLWGQGFGTENVRVRTHYAFEVLGLRLLTTSYLEGNEASRKMQLRNGFVEVGRWPKRYWKRGAFRDEVLMALTREQWLENIRNAD